MLAIAKFADDVRPDPVVLEGWQPLLPQHQRAGTVDEMMLPVQMLRIQRVTEALCSSRTRGVAGLIHSRCHSPAPGLGSQVLGVNGVGQINVMHSGARGHALGHLKDVVRWNSLTDLLLVLRERRR